MLKRLCIVCLLIIGCNTGVSKRDSHSDNTSILAPHWYDTTVVTEERALQQYSDSNRGVEGHRTLHLELDPNGVWFRDLDIDRIRRYESQGNLDHHASVYIRRDAGFFNVRFRDGWFANTVFQGLGSFVRDSFLCVASFSKAVFHDSANFGETVFTKDADFNLAAFRKAVRFSTEVEDDNAQNYIEYNSSPENEAFKHKFKTHRILHPAKFLGKAIFTRDSFLQKADFTGVTFNQKADFTYAVFRRRAEFASIILGDSGRLIFNNTLLPDVVNFYNASPLKNEIDLIGIAPDLNRMNADSQYRPHDIILYRADIPKFHLDYAYFHLLPVDNDSNELTRDEGISLYEALLKNFKDRGQEESYQKLDIEFQQYKARTAHHWYTSMFGILNDKWWSFGYAKQRVFGWTFALLAFFGLLTFPMLPFLQKNVYEMEPLTDKEKKGGEPYRGLRRLWYSFVYTGTLFFKLSLDTKKICFDSRPRNVLGTLYVLVVYMIGVLCLAYMANFVLQK